MAACYDTDTMVYFFYDTSGSIFPDDLAALRLAVDGAIGQLVANGVSPANISEADLTNERYLQWFQQSADKYIVVAFINEAVPTYHSASSDTGPTSSWTSDYNNLLTHLQGVEMFGAYIYAMEPETSTNPATQQEIMVFNDQHVPKAVAGLGGYPLLGLSALGVEYRTNVPSGLPGATYAEDLLAFLQTNCEVPRLDSPVTVHLGENLNGVFADPTVDLSFFQLVDLPVGGSYAIGDQLSGENWYSFLIRDKSRSGGLVTYSGESLLARLGRITPREGLVLVAGVGGVPNPLDLRECLRRFLLFYGVPFVDDLPAFALRVGDEIVVPEADAFVIQPDQENPESIYGHLERFFGPFRGYTFRANVDDELEVFPPAWVDTIGVKLTVYRRRQPDDRTPIRSMAIAPWSTNRAPIVTWDGTVDGAPISGALPALEQSASYETVSVGPYTVRVYWLPTGQVRLWVNPAPDNDVSVGSLFTVTFTFRPEATPGTTDALALENADLGPDEVETTSADTVINQAIVPVRRRSFEAEQAVMQPAAALLRSPKQLAAGAFGSNPEYGPMNWAPTTPVDFLELVNDHAQGGMWFWPTDPDVVIQPGGAVTVSYDVEEWVERWDGPAGIEDAASEANSYTGSASLPANGTEVKLFDFQFPRQSTNFAPGAYGAQGSLYGRWRSGEEPGVELRVANGRFAEFGFLAESGIFGQTYYFLWGVQVSLNGEGITWTVGDLERYRFGFSRAEDGAWEDGALVPSLAESQALYPDRVFSAPELPYEVSAETALAIARGIVEENLTPKTIYRLPVKPAKSHGWVAKPWYVGRGAEITAPGLNLNGRLVAFDYTETHSPGGTSSDLTIDVEVTKPPEGSRAASQRFGRSAYGISHYGQAEET